MGVDLCDGAADAAVPWMNAAFSLDEMHQDADFRAMAADMDGLEKHLLPKSPTTAIGLDTLSAFLSEMEQLDDDIDAEAVFSTPAQTQVETTSPTNWEIQLDPLDPAAAHAAAIGASIAMENRDLKEKTKTQKKKKMSSSLRAKRDKLALEETISQLEQELKRISTGHKKQLAHIHDRWKPIIRQELYKTKRVEAIQRRLHQSIEVQQGKVTQVQDLLVQMRDLLFAQAPVQVSPNLQFDALHDSAIFAMLEQNVLLKHQKLDQQMQQTPFPVTESEMIDMQMAPDGRSMDLSFSRIMPFEFWNVSNTAWTWGRAEFGSSYIGLVFKNTIDTVAVKQEFVIRPPDQAEVTLKLRVVCKRFVSENHSVVQWDGVCDCSSSSDSTQSTTVQETGWVMMQPLEIDESMSIVRSYVQMTPSNSDMTWIQNMITWGDLAKLMLPSSPQAMIDRHQCVENRLLNPASLKQQARTVVPSKRSYGKLRREVYFASLFHEYRFFKDKHKKDPAALAHAWAAFVNNWNRGPAWWLSRLKKERDTFLLRAKRGIIMSVHFACQDAHIACAVPAGRFCDMCGTMGSGHALDQVRGRVGIPAKIRELVLSIDGPHGHTDGTDSPGRKMPRAAARGMDRALTCSQVKSSSRTENYSPELLGDSISDIRNTSAPEGFTDKPDPIQEFASVQASFELKVVKRLEE